MAKRSLTENERQVLYGLVRHPTLNDRELSEALDVKVSTVTAIRRRLRRADYFMTRRIPMMHRVGWELLAGGYGRLSPALGATGTGRLRDTIADKFPGIFYLAGSPDQFLFLSAAPNYTAFKRELEELRGTMHKAGLLDDGVITTAVFPMSLAVVPSFFDFGRVLGQAFEIEDRFGLKLEHEKVGDVELSRKETEVLKGLVRFPEMSDKAVAQRIKASRQAVSKMRREFEAIGLLRTARIPNVSNLGFELFGSVFSRFLPSATLKARSESIERALRAVPLFFYLACNSDAILLTALKSYEHFSSLRTALTKLYDERGFLAGEPMTHIGLVGMTEIVRNCDFADLVGQLKEPASR